MNGLFSTEALRKLPTNGLQTNDSNENAGKDKKTSTYDAYPGQGYMEYT